MHSREELSESIESYIANLEFPVKPYSLYEPIKYSLESGGKRIRPLLTMMACNMFTDKVDHALPCATAVEVFHNFTLLHDDIMDRAFFRRGKPAVHSKWGNNVAILSGDAMMIYSYKLLEGVSDAQLPDVLRIFNDISLKVCEGQQYDMDFESVERVSIEDYITMIELKTAVLMAGAAVIGALCGGASAEDCEKVYAFGRDLGLAFQIQDDLLDSYGTEEKLGKKIGGDIVEGKKTFLTISAFETADEATAAKLSEILRDKDALEQTKIAAVRDIYNSLGVREIAEKAVESYTDRAIAALDALSVSESRKQLMRELALELTKRIN